MTAIINIIIISVFITLNYAKITNIPFYVMLVPLLYTIIFSFGDLISVQYKYKLESTRSEKNNKSMKELYETLLKMNKFVKESNDEKEKTRKNNIIKSLFDGEN